MYAAGVKAAAKDLGLSGIFDQLNERAAAYAKKQAATLVTNIEETTRESLRALITKAFEDGLSPQQIADAIEESFSFSPARAELIARTELADNQMDAALDTWRESGVVQKKQWILGSEHGVPDDCDLNADAGAIPVDESFPSGDDAPTAHPGCVCDVVAVIEVDE